MSEPTKNLLQDFTSQVYGRMEPNAAGRWTLPNVNGPDYAFIGDYIKSAGRNTGYYIEELHLFRMVSGRWLLWRVSADASKTEISTNTTIAMSSKDLRRYVGYGGVGRLLRQAVGWMETEELI